MDEVLGSLTGTLIAQKYRLERLLGQGGMGAVYAAQGPHGPVAVKVLRQGMTSDTRARFAREGWVANRVGHEGVVQIIDGGTDEGGTDYLVMELLEGMSLATYWQEAGGRIPIDQVITIASHVLDILGAAHEKGIVHRDIKPDNVFIGRDGRVKVLDFGIARLLDNAQSATTTGTTIGTPAFMAREQALGLNRSIDARTDVWAIGALMFSLITGEFVHGEAETSAQLMVFAATRQARSLASVAPNVSSRIAAVVDRALAFEMADRWKSATEMRAALEAAASSKQIVLSTLVMMPPPLPFARTEPSGGHAAFFTTLKTRIRRWRLAFLATVLAALFMLGGIALTILGRGSSDAQARGIAPSPRTLPEPSSPEPSPPEPSSPEPSSPEPSSPEPALSNPLAVAPAAPPAASARRRPPPRRPPSKAPSCDPPYFINEQKIKEFKRECVGER